jgi:FAD dependent oxidoreductase TIGR03364
MPDFETDVTVVGAGIVGLAHAYLAAKAGLRVKVFERNPQAHGASVRNFGMIWPIGQPPGPLHTMALRSRNLWLEVLQAAGIPFLPTGSLHAAYREDEAAVGREFCEKAPAAGYDCAWLTAGKTLQRSHALNPEGLLGAVWSPGELTVDPREAVALIPSFLKREFGVEFHFNTAVTYVETGMLVSQLGECRSERIIICGGDDFQTLFPECFRDNGLTRCKLQMLRTVPQPGGWQLGPSLAFGLTFRHYPTFEICESLQPLKERVARENPELDQWGIHVMVSQTGAGELTLGDSHEYGLAVNVFDSPAINRTILDYAGKYLRAPSLAIAQEWHGVYAKHPNSPYLLQEPRPRVRLVTVTSGIGMTMSFGLAEKNLKEMGVPA